jgi:hypothetical protein
MTPFVFPFLAGNAAVRCLRIKHALGSAINVYPAEKG